MRCANGEQLMSTTRRTSPAPRGSQPVVSSAPVKPYRLRSFFHVGAQRYPPRMGSYPRREKAEREARERAAMQPALDCQACGALTLGARFRYCGDWLICDACNQQNPQSRVQTVQRDLLAPRNICLNFIQRTAT
jgi:hypothetical protein